MTPIVLSPYGSAFLANFNDSELAKSSLALDTANISEFGLFIYGSIIPNIYFSMSFG